LKKDAEHGSYVFNRAQMEEYIMSTFGNFHPRRVNVTLKKNLRGYFMNINLNILKNSDAQAFYISFF
jgi:hypothetical protein